MSAGRYQMVIEQGATFILPFIWKDANGTPVDLTAYTARIEVRKNPSLPVVLSMTTDDDTITLGGTTGTIDLALTAEATAALPAGEYMYDLELVSGDNVIRLVEGPCYIRAEITK